VPAAGHANGAATGGGHMAAVPACPYGRSPTGRPPRGNAEGGALLVAHPAPGGA